jgi:DNA polymerase-4
MERTILHCDCNGFFASVECLLHPELKKVPMAVCGSPEERHGIILAKNERAKKYGVQTAETIWQAKRKCPKLVLVPPHHGEYRKYSALVNRIYREYTDQVEPFGIDESWLDVTGSRLLFGDGEHIADEIRERVKAEIGITISAGVSFNKIFAKLGSDYKKPDATTVISRENFRSLVFPMPVGNLLFAGKSVCRTLSRLSIHTIGDLAQSDRAMISRALGKMGEMLHDYANGLDDSPVRSAYEEREIKSVGNGITFRRDLTGTDDIRLGVLALSDSVAARMRKYGVKCQTVQVTIKNPSLKSITRQKTLEKSTYLARVLSDTAMEIIADSWNPNAPIRMLTITGGNLVPEDQSFEQLSLFAKPDAQDLKKQEYLERTLDRIREKFGRDSVSRAGILKNDLGIRVSEKTDPSDSKKDGK